MKWIVGTTSSRKIASVEKVLKEIFTKKTFEIIPHAATSGVSETPWGKETIEGARKRARTCKNHHTTADYFVGMESGLVKRYGTIYEEAWSCVISTDGTEYYGYSSGLKVPDFILRKMKEHNLPHYLIFKQLNNHSDKEANSDTWSQYTDAVLVREISLQESLRNALVQIFAPSTSYYHKK